VADNLQYIKGDLFELAPKNCWIAHSCNAMGVWGKGFAMSLKKRYKKDYEEYRRFCLLNKRQFLEQQNGQVYLTKNKIICLITSYGFSNRVDPPEKIVNKTYEALEALKTLLPKKAVVYSPKFNSGLFNVPWDKTEARLKYFLLCRPDIKWTVVEYEEQNVCSET